MNDKKYKEVVKLTDEMNEVAEQNNKAEEEIIFWKIFLSSTNLDFHNFNF
jgi:hypothetical protein